jgi:hypothetical protein
MGIAEIVRGIDKITFQQAKEIMGKSLRDDYSFIEQNQNNKEGQPLNLRVHVDENL